MKNDESQMKNTLKTIIKAGETAAAVLSKFKKINDPDSKPELRSINVNQCIDEAVDLMGHEFKKRNINISRLQYDSCSMEANYHSLIQVFVNIFINASHAMGNSGSIELSVAQVPDTQNEGEPVPFVEIRIHDTGPGIPEELLPKVTDPFFTTKGKQGTGLGLAICKDIIEDEHRGTFIISNHAQKGLEILIRVPAKKED